jgi:hypothetical protein
MHLQTAAASGESTDAVIGELQQQLGAQARRTRMVFTFYGCDHKEEILHAWLREQFPDAAVMGGSSAGGLMTDKGYVDHTGIGLLMIDDEQGDYGVAAARLGDDAAQTAENLLRQALESCGCAGELPELIWIYQAPGREEAVIEGLRRVVGDNCPIVGGSAADNDVSGRWSQLGNQGCFTDGLVVGVLFPSTSVGYAFQGGYEPAGPNGIVTSIGFTPGVGRGIVTASRGREIMSIDGAPAAQVYNQWSGELIASQLETGGSILAETTMFPLAVDAGRVDGITHYLLVHPESVSANGALRTFCDLQVGARIFAMKGDRTRLVDRAGRVAGQARESLHEGQRSLAGGIVVYCGGCKLAVGDDIALVAESVWQGMGGAPFIGCFTFGEQGRLIAHNVHGNLMISAVVLSQ